MTIPFAYYDAAQRGCADRLRSRSSADVDVSERDMGRGAAIEKAKTEQKTYVVLLTINYDRMSNTYDDLELNFTVLRAGNSEGCNYRKELSERESQRTSGGWSNWPRVGGVLSGVVATCR